MCRTLTMANMYHSIHTIMYVSCFAHATLNGANGTIGCPMLHLYPIVCLVKQSVKCLSPVRKLQTVTLFGESILFTGQDLKSLFATGSTL